MNAFKVIFEIADESRHQEIVLVNREEDLEVALSLKTNKRFIVGNRYSKIVEKVGIPLSKVKLSDSSVTEFLDLVK